MAELIVEGGDLVLRLTPLEKLGALHGDVHVPLGSVRSVEVVEEPWRAMRGVKLLATSIPGVLFVGSRRFNKEKDFGAVSRKQAAVEVYLDDASPFARLLVSVPDPQATAATVRSWVGL